VQPVVNAHFISRWRLHVREISAGIHVRYSSRKSTVVLHGMELLARGVGVGDEARVDRGQLLVRLDTTELVADGVDAALTVGVVDCRYVGRHSSQRVSNLLSAPFNQVPMAVYSHAARAIVSLLG